MNCIGKCMTEDQQIEMTQKRYSKELDKQLQKDFEEVYLASPRIMLMGGSKAGKSTIARQIKLLHGNGFTTDERKQVIKDIRNNIKEAIEAIVTAMSTLTPACWLACPENQFRVEYIQNQRHQWDFDFPLEFYEHVKILWQDEGVRACFERSDEYRLIGCAQYFLDKIDTVKQSDFTPSDQDLLRCQVRHRGQLSPETNFQISKYHCSVFDICQYTERRLWRHILFDSTVWIYLFDISNYNIAGYDETNLLQEALSIFKIMWNYRFLQYQSIVLFLNKQDLLAEKILSGRYELEKYFPEFAHYTTPDDAISEPGEDPRVTRAKYFIRDEFLNICTASGDSERRCYPYFTCAIDTEDFRRVFANCWDNIQSCHIKY